MRGKNSVRESLIGKVTYEHSYKGGDRVNDAMIRGKRIPSRGISKHKGPEFRRRFEEQQTDQYALSRERMERIGDEVSCSGDEGVCVKS